MKVELEIDDIKLEQIQDAQMYFDIPEIELLIHRGIDLMIRLKELEISRSLESDKNVQNERKI